MKKKVGTKLFYLQCAQYFMKNGVHPIDWKGLAEFCGVPIRDLLPFKGKEKDLVLRSMEVLVAENFEDINNIMRVPVSALEKLFLINRYNVMRYKYLNYETLQQVRELYPTAHAYYRKEAERYWPVVLKELIQQGQEEGLFRTDLVDEIVIASYKTLIFSLFHTQDYPYEKYGVPGVYDEILKNFIHSLLSAKGFQLFEKLKEKARRNEFWF